MCLFSGFPDASAGKESACSAGDLGSIPGSGRSPGEGNGDPLQHLAWRMPGTEEPGRLYSPGDREELDRTEWLTHTGSVLVKEKAGGPSPQTQENRAKDHWQDRGLVHPGRVSDPFR